MAISKRKRKYKFQQNWLEDSDFKNWLLKRDENPWCKVCDTKLFPHKNDLVRHKKSEKHLSNIRQVASNKDIVAMLLPSQSKSVKIAEIKMCALLATNNLPFSLNDSLSELCGNIFPDSEIAKDISIKRTKSTNILKNVLGKNIADDLYQNMREVGNYFTLIMDETTDVGSIKQCAFVCTFFDKSNKIIRTNFFDMVETPKGDAVSLYNCLKKSLEAKYIPLSNLVGFSSDTTNVMVGEYNSVFSSLKKDLPHIVTVKCSCHMIHLAASKACLKLPRSVEDMLRNIGSHFSRSYSRQQSFKEFQIFFKTEIHKILSPSITRWLSLEQCVKRVLEQYDPLQAYFRELVFEDPSKTTEDIIKSLDNLFTKIFLEFMSYILGILNDFNKLFQSEAPLLYKLKPETSRLLKTIYSNFLILNSFKTEDVFKFNHDNPRDFVQLEGIYLGMTAHESLNILKTNKEKKNDLDLFYKQCLRFYIELCSEIKKRFVFDDPIFDVVKVVDPLMAQQFEPNSLGFIFNRFPFLKNLIDPQALDNEWREHALLDFKDLGLDKNMSVASYWQKVFKLKNVANSTLFPNLETVISLLLILPYSNASVERVFSHVKNIKTDHRNRLKTDTLNYLIITKEEVARQGGCVKFTPTNKMLNTNVWQN